MKDLQSQTISTLACFHVKGDGARKDLQDAFQEKALEIGRAGGMARYNISADEESSDAAVGTLQRRTATKVSDADHESANVAAEADRAALVDNLIARGARVVPNDRADIRRRGKKNRGRRNGE